MTDNLRDKSVHELCVDKTSCRSEQRSDRSIPTSDFTKDSIRKKMDPPKPASNNDSTNSYVEALTRGLGTTADSNQSQN